MIKFNFIKKQFQFLVLLLFCISINAQVGVNTTTPDASAILDIAATDKGMLVPRVNLNNVANTMLDGVNTAATGLLIYNTNAATIGGSGEGFYYFNGTTWEYLTTTATSGDADWFKENTTSLPTDINSDIYTMGNVAIGKATANYPLDIQESNNTRAINILLSGNYTGAVYGNYIENTNTANGNHYGSYHKLTGTSPGSQYGSYQLIDNSGFGIHYGLYNKLLNGQSNQYGIYNQITTKSAAVLNVGVTNQILGAGDAIVYGIQNTISNTGNNSHYGIYNQLIGAGTGKHYGTYNKISNSNGQRFGTYNEINTIGAQPSYGTYNYLITSGSFSEISGTYNYLLAFGNDISYGARNTIFGAGTGKKYASYNLIPDNAGGVHYGVYSNVLKAGSYAGYFLGSVSIGTTTLNNYILPSTRGTMNQIMQTDGSGNVNWVDPSSNSSTSFWKRIGTNLDVTTIADDIQFSSDQTSITFPATTGTPAAMINMFASGTSNVNRMVLAHSSTYSNFGLEYDDSSDMFRFLSSGNPVVEIDLVAGFPLRVYGTARATNFQSNTTTYPDYVFENYYNKKQSIKSDYSFLSINEVDDFIKENGHLPNVKSYEEIEKQGMTINLAETSITNLEKIEELFLFAIEANKKTEQLATEKKLLKQQLKNQQKKIDEILKLLKDK